MQLGIEQPFMKPSAPSLHMTRQVSGSQSTLYTVAGAAVDLDKAIPHFPFNPPSIDCGGHLMRAQL